MLLENNALVYSGAHQICQNLANLNKFQASGTDFRVLATVKSRDTFFFGMSIIGGTQPIAIEIEYFSYIVEIDVEVNTHLCRRLLRQ